MPRFTGSTQKYDSLGRKVPIGKNLLTTWKEANLGLSIFDSKSEYQAYLTLRDQEAKGLIQNLQQQVYFPLIPATKWFNNITNKNITIREMGYRADFTFTRVLPDSTTQDVVLDCKGWKLKKDKTTGKETYSVYTDDIYQIKKKIFLNKYPQYLFEEM